MDKTNEDQTPDAREILAKIKEPIEVGHEMVTKGSFKSPDTYVVNHEDGSVERFEIVRLGKESFVVRTKEQTFVQADGSKTVVTYDYDGKNGVYVPRDPKASEFEALLRGVATAREKGSMMLWDGVTPDGQKTGGQGLEITKFDAPVARPHLIALLNREKHIPNFMA
ncbi:MAG: hypothetical protein AAB481_01555 [Patescibacteria group bacterium]